MPYTLIIPLVFLLIGYFSARFFKESVVRIVFIVCMLIVLGASFLFSLLGQWGSQVVSLETDDYLYMLKSVLFAWVVLQLGRLMANHFKSAGK